MLDKAFGIVIAVLRGTPFLIQIFLVYYGGPFVGLSLDPIPAGVIGLSIYGAAYFSEIFRSGFAAVPKGHIEAGICVGLTQGQIIRRILLPEMTMWKLSAMPARSLQRPGSKEGATPEIRRRCEGEKTTAGKRRGYVPVSTPPLR